MADDPIVTEIRPGGCVVDPDELDWPSMDVADVYGHAQQGIAQAVAELKRRELAVPESD